MKKLEKMSEVLTADIKALEHEIHHIAGEKFNSIPPSR